MPALVEGKVMKRTVVHTMMFASIAAGLVGCQSGPRWAWWKPWEKSSAETAVAASPAAPALPSASATPQAVAASGLQPAASPSATNLAGTGSALAASPLGVQPASPSTIANAPLATYPTTGAPPINNIPPSSVASTTPAAPGSIPPLSTTPKTSSLAATRQAAPLANVPAAGPYDPNGYQPSASLAASSAERHHRLNCRSLRQLCDRRGGPIHPACFHTCDDPDRECCAGRPLCDVRRECGPGRQHNDARRSLFEYCSRVDRRHQCAGRCDGKRSLRPAAKQRCGKPARDWIREPDSARRTGRQYGAGFLVDYSNQQLCGRTHGGRADYDYRFRDRADQIAGRTIPAGRHVELFRRDERKPNRCGIAARCAGCQSDFHAAACNSDKRSVGTATDSANVKRPHTDRW